MNYWSIHHSLPHKLVHPTVLPPIHMKMQLPVPPSQARLSLIHPSIPTQISEEKRGRNLWIVLPISSFSVVSYRIVSCLLLPSHPAIVSCRISAFLSPYLSKPSGRIVKKGKREKRKTGKGDLGIWSHSLLVSGATFQVPIEAEENVEDTADMFHA